MVQKVNLGMTEDIETEINAVASSVAQINDDLAALGGASTRDVGTGVSDLVETSQLDTRLGTTGNLGTAAVKTVGTADGNLPEISYQEVTIDTSSFSADPFTLYCLKVGRLVTLSWGVASHPSNDTAFSGSGEVPVDFLPTTTSANIYAMTVDSIATANISNAGIISFSYRDWAGLSFSRTDNLAPGSISYVV